MIDNRNLNSIIIEQMLALLPVEQATALLQTAADESVSSQAFITAVQETLFHLDWTAQQPQLGDLINQILPLAQLVPDIYRDWRPVVRDAVTFIGSHLSAERLVPKLIEQIQVPADLPLEQRLLILIKRMPALQKIGQIVARNRNLDPAFRAELTRLENSIHDVSQAEIEAELKDQLGPSFQTHRIELEETFMAEASVSAVIGFTWLNPVTNRRERGAFKVLKPYINAYFEEELDLLQGLANFFESHHRDYVMSEVNLGDLFRGIRTLLEQEIDLANEQNNLTLAFQRYRRIAGIRTPRLIPELSTPTVTAMIKERGIKVTDAFATKGIRRIEVASRIIEAFLAVPLFVDAQETVFHADPHAGNLFVDEKTHELIIFDWALTERLNREDRRYIVLLMLALILRDERQIFRAIAGLCQDNLARDQEKAAIVRRRVTSLIRRLSPLTVPGLKQVLSLLDSIVLSGVAFSSSLTMFRKVLFTLDGVLQDVAPETPVEPLLGWYFIRQSLKSNLLTPLSGDFQLPLSRLDKISLAWSAQWFGPRLGLQTTKQMRDIGRLILKGE